MALSAIRNKIYLNTLKIPEPEFLIKVVSIIRCLEEELIQAGIARIGKTDLQETRADSFSAVLRQRCKYL